MKDIGFTQEGNRLVEMSRDEYMQFVKLCEAVEGRSFPQLYDFHAAAFRESFDFAHTFEVVRAFYLDNFRISEFEHQLKVMKEGLNRV